LLIIEMFAEPERSKAPNFQPNIFLPFFDPWKLSTHQHQILTFFLYNQWMNRQVQTRLRSGWRVVVLASALLLILSKMQALPKQPKPAPCLFWTLQREAINCRGVRMH
jgi:hypothetical protein